MTDPLIESQHDDTESEMIASRIARVHVSEKESARPSGVQFQVHDGSICVSVPLESIGSLDPATGDADTFEDSLLGLA